MRGSSYFGTRGWNEAMKVSELLETRRRQWQELESFADVMESHSRRMMPQEVARFAALYRAACADLALAESYRFPPGVIQYLNHLVGRAHHVLYRSRTITARRWFGMMLFDVPRQLFSDWSFWLAMGIFWGVFLLCMWLAATVDEFALEMVGQNQLDMMESMYSEPVDQQDEDQQFFMLGFYISHNAGIGLRCFAMGLLFGIGGLFELLLNSAILGTIFGYMTTIPQGENFYQFVTAHGPFELTAIVMAGAAGMRLGFSLISTGGLKRLDSLRKAAVEAVPTMTAFVVLFGLAALIEAFISPSGLEFFRYRGIEPYTVKLSVAVISTVLLFVYIVVLGGLAFLNRQIEGKSYRDLIVELERRGRASSSTSSAKIITGEEVSRRGRRNRPGHVPVAEEEVSLDLQLVPVHPVESQTAQKGGGHR
jgi:uncharacterized membrane protein SpoIIM required for sporulation